MPDDTMSKAQFADNSAQRIELQEALMDNMPCGAGIYEFKDGRISLIYQNKVYWELVGLNEAAYPDESEMSAIHRDDLPLVMQELSSAIEQHRDVSCDIRLRHLTKGYRPVHLSGRVVFKDTGALLIYAAFLPIPELVIEARQQQARLALLTNSIPGGIAAYEGTADALDAIKLIYYSDGFCKLFGYTREEYENRANKSPLGMIASEDKPRMIESILALVHNGVPMDLICRARVKGGETKWINVKALMGEPNGDKMTVNAVFLAMNSDEAERLAEARAQSEKLSTALRAARRADLAKSQFLSFMSHEIRTPLNAILGYISIAQNELNTAMHKEERNLLGMKIGDCLNKSHVASKHLLSIINDVLDMSAVESGKLKIDRSPFDFSSLISSITVMFFSLANAKSVDFSVAFDKPTEEWFVGDQLRVNQVLTNLLSNAVKFTPEGGSVKLKISETYSDGDSIGFRFTVSDTGIGMSREYLKHIWTPFEQAEATTSRRYGGSGLGLSITKNLVELMGGTIEVESTVDVGSTFTVNLSFGRMKQPATATGMDFSEVNALVVDDEGSTCDYIKLLFDRCGAGCSTFTSGSDAIEAFSEAQRRGVPYNLCLVDWRMPRMNGAATISEIRKLSTDSTPVVVVTAYDYNEVMEQTENLGINRFVSKPLFQSSLFDLLANVYGKKLAEEAKGAYMSDFGGVRVLLVEDNNMNMEIAKHILSTANISVDCAWNGQEAVNMFFASEPGTYKAILMDVHMPVLDGYQATRLIREAKRGDAKSVPIIAMTADVFAEGIEQANSAGMNDHISKPINNKALFKLLKAYIS